MSNRLLRAILALYPRGFRRRYGREVQDLVKDLEACGDSSRLWLVSELLVGALAERLQAVRPHARLTIPTLVVAAALAASVGSHWLPGGQRFTHATASTGTYAPPTAKPSTRLDPVQAPTGQPTPLHPASRVAAASPRPTVIELSNTPVARDLPAPPPPPRVKQPD